MQYCFFDAYSKFIKESVESDFYRGLSFFKLEDYNSAAKYLKQAEKIDKENPDILFHLGLSYYQLNKKREAKKTLSKLYYLDADLYDSLNIVIQ
ncbi:tetratricopeptide repeat protein [Candidatus Marinimicrobia bacterium]|nr:tetratricopeptide repeat protein [Candidatus Neomarinimicrobiota bacterium]